MTEVEVFEVRLNVPQFDEAVLRQIDKEIPYHILFVLTCEGKAQAWIGYKETAASGSNAFKVSRYYHTGWMPDKKLQFRVDGDQCGIEKAKKRIGGAMMDDKYTPISPDSPLGQMLEKFKGFDISKLASVYPTFDYRAITRQMQENIEVDPIIPEGYFERTQEYQQRAWRCYSPSMKTLQIFIQWLS